jgi:hypothetical protein
LPAVEGARKKPKLLAGVETSFTMPIIIQDTDTAEAVASPELDHRIEVGSLEYDAMLKKVPAVGK